MEKDELRILLDESRIPFFGTFEEYETLNSIVKLYRKKIDQSDSLREVIFDSWFLFDYLVRMLLLKAFDINSYENEDFDPMYDYLPQSFEKCLRSFEMLLKQQRKLYAEELHPNTIRTTPMTSMPGSFFLFLHNKDPKKVVELMSDFQEYEELYESEYIQKKEKFDLESDLTEVVSKIWLSACQNIDSDWFKTIRKLNTTRNKAAHIFKEEVVYKSFGIHGENKLVKLKSKIENIVDKSFYFKNVK